jgi:diacylglycerol kinase family enzyme
MEMEKPLHVNIDGEPIEGIHFEFQCCPKALSVVLGDAASRQSNYVR